MSVVEVLSLGLLLLLLVAVVWITHEAMTAPREGDEAPADRLERIATKKAAHAVNPLALEGKRVRLMVPIPEWGLEVGTIGKITTVILADDTHYHTHFQGPDGTDVVFMFEDGELWQLEVLS